ncbi:putative ATP-dependent RNA helicase vasa-like [Amphibalanus amphitrite]|uniref:RNA helicase n=2 Tax=Amphibalanus amphitrite TaxID=1232801 RepID=A0A6A4XHR0_AMPAM|nr:putative ATP-dependent RNA helicase vasa-like [Amphibalanus amphitrite]
MSRDCPQGGGGSRACFNCGEEGHQSRECPNPAKTRTTVGEDGKPREIYVPTESGEDALYKDGISSGINFSKYQHIPCRVTGNNICEPISSFEQSGLRPILLENIKRSGYTTPTPVQKYAIPIVMNNRDLMACAQTGSGKTAAFLLPVIHSLLEQNVAAASYSSCQEPACVVVSPTRELAMQIYNEARKFSNTSVIRAVVAYGGTSVNHQSNMLQKGCHILVATPGRLLDFVEKGKVSFGQCKYFVLDEADRMLDMGFQGDIDRMINHPSMPPKGTRHTLMFSATFPEQIQRLAANYLNEYLFLTVGLVGAASTDVTQSFLEVGHREKRDKLESVLRDIGGEKTLVFVEAKRVADFIASHLCQAGFPTTSIHGDRLQREREEALADFKYGKTPTLIATSVASRGLDIKGVACVVNYDLPKAIDDYVHRIGRTGRVGNTGKAISFYDCDRDSGLAGDLVKILSEAQQEVPDFLQRDAGSADFGGGGGMFGGNRDIRRGFGGGSGGGDNQGYNQSAPTQEAEEDWG